MHIRQFVPKIIRQQIRQYQRKMADQRSGYTQRFSRPRLSHTSMPYSIPLVQEIKSSYLYENKIANIKRSSEEIGKVVIFPNEIFSFWETIGIPNAQNGYLKGRNIIAGKLGVPPCFTGRDDHCGAAQSFHRYLHTGNAVYSPRFGCNSGLWIQRLAVIKPFSLCFEVRSSSDRPPISCGIMERKTCAAPQNSI
jgi:VanW like protein